MLLLTNTTDKLQVITSAAVTTDVHASWIDYTATTVTPGRTNSAITTAVTTDVVGAPAASTYRNVKTLHIRNKHATSSQTVTVQHTDGTTVAELFKVTLAAGETLEYVEGQGIVVRYSEGGERVGTGQVESYARTTSDLAHALTSLIDVAGLTFPIVAGATYRLDATLIHTHGAVTTGIGFSVNGPASPTSVQGGVQTISARGAATAGAFASYGFTAYEGGSVSIANEVINTDYISTLSCLVVNGVNGGTLAVRVKAEVAATVTVKAQSFATLLRLA